jgi:adenine phosphoribosyltransferase
MHKDAIKPGQKAVVIDDIVAVGGTMDAAKHLIEELGGKCVGMVALMGLTALPGVERLKDSNLKCLIYDDVEDK